jgi:thousand and one amino acid protein kinase
VKTQTLQYKALQTQMLSQLARGEHRDLIAKLKDEQKRKLAQLASQYDQSIESMVQDQTVSRERGGCNHRAMGDCR